MPRGSDNVGHVTVTPPKWAILVPTLGERRLLFERLMRNLLPQLDAHGGQVQVVAWHNNGSPALPKIRQTMVLSTSADYISFVDDDDITSPDYVDEVMSALGQEPDYVGFQVQCYSDGAPIGIAHHSLEYTRWRNLKGRFERDISHINPIRTTLARRAKFTKAISGAAEDRIWADQLRRLNVLRSEVFIPRVMYHYLYSTSKEPGQGTRWQTPDRKLITPGERSNIDHPHFTWSNDA